MSMSQGQSLGDALGSRAIDVVVSKPTDFGANMSGIVSTAPAVAMTQGQKFSEAVGNSGDVHSRLQSPLLEALCMAKMLPASGFTIIGGTMANPEINRTMGIAASELKQAEAAIAAAVQPSAPNIDKMETANAGAELVQAQAARQDVIKAVMQKPKM